MVAAFIQLLTTSRRRPLCDNYSCQSLTNNVNDSLFVTCSSHVSIILLLTMQPHDVDYQVEASSSFLLLLHLLLIFLLFSSFFHRRLIYSPLFALLTLPALSLTPLPLPILRPITLFLPLLFFLFLLPLPLPLPVPPPFPSPPATSFVRSPLMRRIPLGPIRQMSLVQVRSQNT